MAPDLIDALTAAAAAAQTDAIDRLAVPSVDDQLAALAAARRERGRARRRRRVAAAVGLTAGAVAVLALWARPRPLEFEVGAARAHGVLGARVEAPAGTPVPLHFSDGTEVVLGASGRARVLALAREGAEIVVERGTVQAAVVHRRGTAWVVAVGPFDVHVRGTRFEAAWDPGRELFRLKMYDGSVDVTGRCLPAARTLAAGEELEIACAAGGSADVPAASEAPAPRPAPPAPVVDAPASPAAPVRAAATVPGRRADRPARMLADAAPVPAPSLPSWRGRLAAGDAEGALAALEEAGTLGEACGDAPAPELMRLGDSARAAGRRAPAAQIYAAVRARFPGSDVAAVAAFHLGQVAFDQGGTAAEARAGFAAYVDERPGGPLVQEALGRLLELEARPGAGASRAKAGALARRYLGQFPYGPHASLARLLATP